MLRGHRNVSYKNVMKRFLNALLASILLPMSTSVSQEMWLRLRYKEWWNGVDIFDYGEWVWAYKTVPSQHFSRLLLYVTMLCQPFGGLWQKPAIAHLLVVSLSSHSNF